MFNSIKEYLSDWFSLIAASQGYGYVPGQKVRVVELENSENKTIREIVAFAKEHKIDDFIVKEVVLSPETNEPIIMSSRQELVELPEDDIKNSNLFIDNVVPLTTEGNVTPLTVEGNVAPLTVADASLSNQWTVSNEYGIFDNVADAISDYYSKCNSDKDKCCVRKVDITDWYKENKDKSSEDFDFSKIPNDAVIPPNSEDDEIVYDDEKQELDSTDVLYADKLNICRDIFINKLEAEGPTWRVMRPESVTDQIFIRYTRLYNQNIENLGDKIESFKHEFEAIVNYSVIALIQLELGMPKNIRCYCDITNKEIINLYDKYAQEAYETMKLKNAEYLDVWKQMRFGSYIDFIGMKTLKLIEHERFTPDSYVMRDIYLDIINYAIFPLLRLD